MTHALDLNARDVRSSRAVEQVLARYQITAEPDEDGWRVFRLTGGTKPYLVKVHPEWAGDPSCDCPDAERGGGNFRQSFCKHLIGVLRSQPDLSYQLLELHL